MENIAIWVLSNIMTVYLHYVNKRHYVNCVPYDWKVNKKDRHDKKQRSKLKWTDFSTSINKTMYMKINFIAYMTIQSLPNLVK